ncbi:DUF2235 domain-containing protein [Chryseobacterium sp. SNU WT5]|uniref:T6SS phospholipase effector Tle1-like catalytic domain-containing protein n=1 Tax=Chryseobacterium sp. SNU WT5 TaxID=2594269 RepID=UPI00117D3A50|nr:DUF2235 domain-containing protein [Chryseobacterium sp. SNU WT5]QDP85338.1 DUF2235 domain-containing protein [Chryseobacterium sp. SNU WT5]
MANIIFQGYDPPPAQKGFIDIRIGVFFDGTQNNRTNTNSRLGLESDKGNKAYKKMSDGKTDSYTNDLSNVARKELHYAKGAYIDSVYVEGIGTDDFGADSDDPSNHDGVAFGRGTQGIIAKVRKGCELIATKIKLLKGNNEINTVYLDVFGFSRGAAAARNFIYELSKNKYDSTKKSYTASTGQKANWKTDSHGYRTEEDKLPKNGHLGLQLQDKGVSYVSIQIRFVGLYDTVSSFDPTSFKNANFENDVAELHLNSLKLEINNLYKAKKIIHFCADDEHRKNFMLTPTAKQAGGKDFYLPGVHSDVGGCYTDKITENNLQIMDVDNYWGDGRSDGDWDDILNNDLNDLIAQGWFKRSQVVKPDSDHQTHATRKGIRNSYSFVTLHLMAEKLNTEYNATIKMNTLNAQFGIPKPANSQEIDLLKVKKRLENYITGKQPKMTYYTKPEIEQLRTKLDLKNVNNVARFNLKVNDHNMLNKLRSKYIHWNSKFGDGIGAYEPNYKIVGKSILRFRKIEPNS